MLRKRRDLKISQDIPRNFITDDFKGYRWHIKEFSHYHKMFQALKS